MNKNLALFTTSYGLVVALDSNGNDDMAQISERIEVDFPELSKNEIISNQLLAIDALIDQAKQEAIDKMNNLNQRKQELLALTHQGERNEQTA